MTRPWKGVLHVHSTYSDGEFSLGELRRVFLQAGCRFACLTDHAEYFDAAKLSSYVAECAALSDDRFSFVPGLEYNCADRMHVLGYGVTELLESTDPQEVIAGIQGRSGVAVIAHPKDAHFLSIEGFGRLPCGIETWNSKYDGRYAPRPRTFHLLRRLRRRSPNLQAFYGVDLHWRNQYRGLLTQLLAPAADQRGILGALKSGEYVGLQAGIKLPSDGELPVGQLARFQAVNRCSHAVRQSLRGVKRLLDRCGVALPASWKARIRGVF